MALAENTPVDQGDIYWITLPSKGGREQHGRRPCVVMSRKAVNAGNPVVVVPLTSNMTKANAYNIQIPAPEIIRDVGSTSQIVDSVALCGQHSRLISVSLKTNWESYLSLRLWPSSLASRTCSTFAKFQTEPLPHLCG